MPKIVSGLRREPERFTLGPTGLHPRVWFAAILLIGLIHVCPVFANPVQTPHVRAQYCCIKRLPFVWLYRPAIC
jgi:hypothetical protein